MGEEMEKRIRGEFEEGVLGPAKIRLICVRKGEFWSIGASSTRHSQSCIGVREDRLGPGSERLVCWTANVHPVVVC